MSVKQVLIWRNELKVRKGKFGSQIAHGSMAWLTNRIRDQIDDNNPAKVCNLLSSEEKEWINGAFTKIVLTVETEQDLLNLYQQAREAGIIANLIVDNGATEFNGIKTTTVLAIGPDKSEKIDLITGPNSVFGKLGKIKLY